MTKAEFTAFFNQCLDDMRAIRAAKNSDYTGTTDDPFANFRMAENLGITSTERALMVRMMDKMARLKSFIEKGSHEVKDESVKDSCIDLANYALIFAGLWTGQNRKPEPPAKVVGIPSGAVAVKPYKAPVLVPDVDYLAEIHADPIPRRDS